MALVCDIAVQSDCDIDTLLHKNNRYKYFSCSKYKVLSWPSHDVCFACFGVCMTFEFAPPSNQIATLVHITSLENCILFGLGKEIIF